MIELNFLLGFRRKLALRIILLLSWGKLDGYIGYSGSGEVFDEGDGGI